MLEPLNWGFGSKKQFNIMKTNPYKGLTHDQIERLMLQRMKRHNMNRARAWFILIVAAALGYLLLCFFNK